MAGSIDHGGYRSNRRRRRPRPMSEINVTPFVDVMLVLLIVFMVAAPLMTSGVPVDLPEAEAKALAIDKPPITVSIDRDGKVFIGEDEITIDALVPKLTALAEKGSEERIYVRGDRSSNYGVIMKVMGTINGAGFKHIGLVALKDPSS